MRSTVHTEIDLRRRGRWLPALLAIAVLFTGGALFFAMETGAEPGLGTLRFVSSCAFFSVVVAFCLCWHLTDSRRQDLSYEIPANKSASVAELSQQGAMQTLLDAIPGMMFVMAADGSVEYVNQKLAEELGTPLLSLQKDGWMALVHPEDSERLMQRWLNSLRNHSPLEIEYRLAVPKNAWRWVHCRVAPLKNSAGLVLRWYGVVIDINERRRAEDALRQSEYVMRMTIETIPALVWRSTAAGNLDYINDRVLQYTGKTLTDFARTGWADLVHPEDLDSTVQILQHSLATGESYSVSYRFRGTHGRYRWFQVRAEPLRDTDGNILHWYGLHIDIDDQRNAEEALRARERQLRLVTETLPALIWTADPAGFATYFNRRVIDFTGKAVTDLDERGWAPLMHPDDLPITSRLWAEAVAKGIPFEATRRLRGADGAYRWFRARAEALRDQAGCIVCWYGIDVDIDDRKRAEDAFRHAQARLSRAAEIATVGELSASIAHEMNQPLSAVVANAYACMQFLKDPVNLERARGTAASIVSDGNAAAAVVHKMRALFKRAAPNRAALEVADVIVESVRLLEEEIRAKAVDLTWDLEPHLPRLVADRIQVQQVISNLVRNAIEAMEGLDDRTRRLHIAARSYENNTLLIQVQDNGMGIEDADRIFEPFFTTKPNGMGVGLSICRWIIEAHAGRLWAAHNDHDLGTTFSLLLPLEIKKPLDTSKEEQ